MISNVEIYDDDSTRIQMPDMDMSDYLCCICQELMLEPTTLMCGHSFCRLCLVKWFHSSGKRECMVCKKTWTGVPKVSVTLRSTIKSLFPHEYEDRIQTNHNDADSQSQIVRFEAHLTKLDEAGSQRRSQGQNQEQNRNRLFDTMLLEQLLYLQRNNTPQPNHSNWKLLGAFVLGLLVTLIIWGIFHTVGTPRTEVENTQVWQWSSNQCIRWLEELGPWTKKELVPVFMEKHIDGPLLMSLATGHTTDTAITDAVSGLDQEEKVLFDQALYYFKVKGRLPPSDLWEYKDINQIQTAWLLPALTLVPRLTIFYLYIFDYQESFLPLIHVVSRSTHHPEINKYTLEYPKPDGHQKDSFIVRLIFFPRVTIVQPFLQSTLSNSNPVALTVLSLRCWAIVIVDLLILYQIFRGKCDYKKLGTERLKEIVGVHMCWAITYMFWSVIPSFVINIWFLFVLYVQTTIIVIQVFTLCLTVFECQPQQQRF